jgi:hypothetical protein
MASTIALCVIMLVGLRFVPEPDGDFVRKHKGACSGAEILEEVLLQFRFDRQLDAIMASSGLYPLRPAVHQQHLGAA